MSGSQTPPSGAGAGGANDPSMEDILASIRRILSEEEPTPAPPHAAEASLTPEPEPLESTDGVLMLDSSMLVPEEPIVTPEPQSRPEPLPPPVMAPSPVTLPPEMPSPAPPLMAPPPPVTPLGPPPSTLVAPEAAAAAASSIGNLMRTLAAQQALQVRSGGPTIEDIVREELRPMLKQWLDTNLPGMVERLVRTEIERVVSRNLP